MNKIGIIGFGIVGRALQHGFAQDAEFKIYDLNPKLSQNTLQEVCEDSEFIFICVPTPRNKDGSCDISIVEDTIDRCMEYVACTDKILIIKSTIVPGTTSKMIEKYPDCNIICNPEFLTERSYKLDFINTSRIILGGDVKLCERVALMYRDRFIMTPILIVDPTTAEMIKYTANAFFSTKLSFFNEIYDMCRAMNIKYERVMRGVLMDGRIGNSHYSVPGHDGKRGFGGKCFPKDLTALITLAYELDIEPLIMLSAWNKNLRVRGVKNEKVSKTNKTES